MRVLGSLVVGVLVLGGCTGDSEPEEPPGTSSASESSSASPSAEESPTSSPSPEVEPASGEQVVLGTLSFRVPEDFIIPNQTDETMISRGEGTQALSGIQVLRSPSFGVESTIERDVRLYLSTQQFTRAPRRLEPVTVGGLRMFHVAGKTDSILWSEGYGAQTPENVYVFTFEFEASRVPAKERRELIDSVLATVEIDE